METRHDCTCSKFIDDNGFGMCRKSSANTSSHFCYVNEPSNCNDLVYDEMENRNYSEQACLNIFGKKTLCTSRVITDAKTNDQTFIPDLWLSHIHLSFR